MKRIFIPTVTSSDWQRLLRDPKLHWKSGRSAMSTAACWEANEPNLPPEISGVLEASGDKALTSLELLVAIPEWEVELPGKGNASQTDVLAITRNEHGLVILGVEAKVDEKFGPLLGDKRMNATKGELERVSYLERELGCSSPLADSIRYQLLHRTVSAVLTARAFHAGIAVMLVQSFSPASRWREDFEAFAAAINSKRVTDNLYEVDLAGSPRLMLGWCKGAEEFLSVELPSAL